MRGGTVYYLRMKVGVVMDKEKVIDELMMLKRFLPSTMWEPINDAIAMLKEQKELVRCADCRHAEVSQSGLIKCRGIFRSREWYCADGERRDDDA